MDLNSESSPQLVTDVPTGAKPVNRQLYENSSLAGSLIEELSLGAQSLHGARKPNLAIEHEKPEHRLILILKLQGLSNREIAKHSGYTEAWISQVTRQPWFTTRMMTMIEEAGQDTIQTMLQTEGVNSLNTIIHLRDNAESEQVRANMAVHILDRLMGKPVTKAEVRSSSVQTIVNLDKIDEQLKQLEEEERKLLNG